MDSTGRMSQELGDRVLAAFRRAVSDSPAYRVLLRERGVEASAISDLKAFAHLCPSLTKQDTFSRFPLSDLVAPGTLETVAHVMTSSGHGGRFSFGIETRQQAAEAAAFADGALDAAFQVKSRRTLAINCLPMGVGISSRCMAVATVSVREDMATAVIGALGPHFEQLLVIADPLFTPCLLAHASKCGVEWRRHDTKFLLGEEFFGEAFRSFVGRRLGYSSEELNAGVIRSSFGVGELGLHVLYETPVTIALRRDAAQNSIFAKDIFKTSTPVHPVPMLLTYDDERTYVEVEDPDETGFGKLTLTMLGADGALPLVRYQTGDLAALLDEDDISSVARRHGIRCGAIPRHVVALRGRRADMLPDGCHLSTYKEALFASDDLASAVTGAYRVEPTADGITLHVQLMPGLGVQPSMEGAIRRAFGSGKAPRRIRVWRYEAFPFGMRLDYERKFRYYDQSLKPNDP